MQNAKCKMQNEQRLIDANALKRRFEKQAEADEEMFGVYIPECFPADDANEIVDLMPTVDAVEVVRCKDCKKWKCHGMPFDITKGTCYNPRFHFHHGHVLNECFMPVTRMDDFCSYGERREEK